MARRCGGRWCWVAPGRRLASSSTSGRCGRGSGRWGATSGKPGARDSDGGTMSLYHLNVTLHVLAALLWLGGMFFLAVVGAPVLRKVEPAALRARLFQELG